MNENTVSIISFNPKNSDLLIDILKLLKDKGFSEVTLDTKEINDEEPRLIAVVKNKD